MTKKAPVKKAPVKKATAKKAPAKKVVKKAPAKKVAPKKPAHPLMVNGKRWDREKVMTHICNCLATSSRGIGKILQAGYEGNTLPDYSTIMDWLEEGPAYAERYARAREAQADYMADEIMEISDNASNDWMTREDPENPGYALNGEHIQRSRLRVDSRKWLASKLKPKKYGEKVDMNHSGSVSVVSQVLDDLDGNDSGLPG